MWILYYFIGWAITSFILAVQASYRYDMEKDKEKESRELIKVALVALLCWWLVLPFWVVLNSGISIGKLLKRRKNVKSKTIKHNT